MTYIKRIAPPLLLLAALAVVLATAFTNHESDFGRVPLPPGGVVDLPKGTLKVYYEHSGETVEPFTLLAGSLAFEVRPIAGGPPLREEATVHDDDGEVQVEKSQDLNALGAVAKLDVPADGKYVVSGTSGRPPGEVFLDFGVDPFTAVARRWRLLAGLLAAAILIALIPVPQRRHGHWDEPAVGVGG
jgi:hypothetical protein